MTIAVEADDAMAIIEDPADEGSSAEAHAATAIVEDPAEESSSAAASRLEAAEQVDEDI